MAASVGTAGVAIQAGSTAWADFQSDLDAYKESRNVIGQTYKSIKDSPNYPEGFSEVQNGTTKNPVKNRGLLEELREIESGQWQKVYKEGFDINGNKISIHYFQSQSGKVFNVKVLEGWSY